MEKVVGASAAERCRWKVGGQRRDGTGLRGGCGLWWYREMSGQIWSRRQSSPRGYSELAMT